MNEEQRQADTRDLMIRLDERLKSVQESLAQIQLTIAAKVENDQSYKEMQVKVDKMWDLQNKALGYIAAWTVIVSTVIYFLADYIKGVIK